MPNFKHKFVLSKYTDTCRTYTSGDSYVRIDFVSDSCMRVAVYNDEAGMLPTFCINPNNEFLTTGRSRLSTDGFGL